MDNLKTRISSCINEINGISKNIPIFEAEKINTENLQIKNFLNELISKRYFYKVHNETAKILTIIACHSNSEDKYLSVINNFNYLKFPNNDIIIISSENESYSEQLKNEMQDKCKNFIEVPNDVYMDFGKWNYVCDNYNVRDYDFVVFTNDSFFITSSIYPFYNKMIETQTNLYGLTNSSEINNHYQSYLFGIRQVAIDRFQNFYKSKKNLVDSKPRSLILNIELNMSNYFLVKECYLNLDKFPTNLEKNLFFHNDLLYGKLLLLKILPIIKLRRLNKQFIYT
jgi:hypothetical protein